jgi:hypothetical protein
MLTIRMAVFFLAIAGFWGTPARASTYQMTILPAFLTNFYGPGESANDFASNHWSTLDTGVFAPPMFSYAQITFTTADINNDIEVMTPNAQAFIPELNDLGPIPKGDNLTPASAGWFTEVLWIPGLEFGEPSDEVVVTISQGAGPNEEQWNFTLFFPAGSMGVGNALNDPNASATYTDFHGNTGGNVGNSMDYISPSASSVQLAVPEPSSLPAVSIVCLAGLAVLRRRRMAAAHWRGGHAAIENPRPASDPWRLHPPA